MSIYFDYKTINELTGDNYIRQPKEFTLDELSRFNGRNGKPAYVAIEGVVYDVTRLSNFGTEEQYGFEVGKDLSEQFNKCHRMMNILNNAPKVGVLDDCLGSRDKFYRQQDTSKFSPDDWVRYITPIVTYGLREPNQGLSPQRIYQRVAILGVLVGLGKTPQEAINQLQDWQNSGASQLLKGGTNGGTGSGTTGGMGGFGNGGNGIGTGTGGGFGNVGNGIGPGTAGGFGIGENGIGPGTSGGVGIESGTGAGS